MKRELESLRVFLFLLIVLPFFFAAAPALAGSLEDRIKALEEEQRANREEISQLKEQLEAEGVERREMKAEQMDLRKRATEAADALPTFTYRPRRGLTIRAADRSWDLSTRFRWHWRVMFFDNKAREESGFSQGDIALRRWRIKFLPNWANGFYGLDMEFDGGVESGSGTGFDGNRNIQIQKGEFHARFSKLNPYFPDFAMGFRVSGFFSRHDTNWGSSTGGLFDRSMFQDGAGVGAGSQNNAAGFNWEDVPLDPLLPGVFLLQTLYSNQGLTNVGNHARPDTDNRSAHVGFNIEPFSKLKNKWLKGFDIGVSWHMDQIHPDDSGRSFFRVRTTERQRLRLIEMGRDLKDQRHLVMPHFGWKVGPYWLRTAFGYNRGEQVNGRGVEGWQWRIVHELFVWSPKGFLTGSTSTPRSLMFYTGFERDNYRAAANGLRNCSSTGGSCERAYAYNPNVGFWYFIRPGLRVGTEYSFYHVNKIGRGAADLNGARRGEDTDFNSVDLGITFDF